MPTNRRRVLRMSKNRIFRNVSPAYIEDLKARDFLGELTEAEIPLTKRLGVYAWDGYMKREKHADE